VINLMENIVSPAYKLKCLIKCLRLVDALAPSPLKFPFPN